MDKFDEDNQNYAGEKKKYYKDKDTFEANQSEDSATDAAHKKWVERKQKYEEQKAQADQYEAESRAIAAYKEVESYENENAKETKKKKKETEEYEKALDKKKDEYVAEYNNFDDGDGLGRLTVGGNRLWQVQRVLK